MYWTIIGILLLHVILEAFGPQVYEDVCFGGKDQDRVCLRDNSSVLALTKVLDSPVVVLQLVPFLCVLRLYGQITTLKLRDSPNFHT